MTILIPSMTTLMTTKNRLQALATFTIVALASVVMASAQTAQPPLPFKAPPGQQVTITSSYSTYNFSALNRDIPLPMESFIWKPSEVKSGYKIDSKLHKASKAVTALYENLPTLFPELGAPSRVVVQGVKGKQGPGTILYVEYPTDMPADARLRIIRALYGKDVTPEPPGAQIDQHLVSRNMFIIWSFKDTKSLAREAHQKKAFDLVSTLATAWDKTQPKKPVPAGQSPTTPQPR